MKNITLRSSVLVATAFLLGVSPSIARAMENPALLDDFSDVQHNKYGGIRLLIDDKSVGSQSHATQKCENGVLSVEGELVPGRGAPAFISVPMVLSSDGKPRDLSAYEGVRLRVKVMKGSVSVQASSTDVQNYDYHTSAPITRNPDAFQEIKIRFKDMRRGFSEQTALNLKDITSVNLVAFNMGKDAFAYEVAEIGFY